MLSMLKVIKKNALQVTFDQATLYVYMEGERKKERKRTIERERERES